MHFVKEKPSSKTSESIPSSDANMNNISGEIKTKNVADLEKVTSYSTIKEKGVTEPCEDDLEKFYEQKQSFVEEAILKRSMTNYNNKYSISNIKKVDENPHTSKAAKCKMNISKTERHTKGNSIDRIGVLTSQTPKRNVEESKILSYEQYNQMKPTQSVGVGENYRPLVRSKSARGFDSREQVEKNGKSKVQQDNSKVTFKLKITNDSVEELETNIPSSCKIQTQQKKIENNPIGRKTQHSKEKKPQVTGTFRKGVTQTKTQTQTQAQNTQRPKLNNNSINSFQTKQGATGILSAKAKCKEQATPISVKSQAKPNQTIQVDQYNALITLSEKLADESKDGKILKNAESKSQVNHEHNEHSNESTTGYRQLSLRQCHFPNDLSLNLGKKADISSNESRIYTQSDLITRGNKVITENYVNDLKEIYCKRRASRELQIESQDKNINFFAEFYQKNIKWKNEKRDKSSTLKEKIETAERQQCPFTPQVTNSSRKILLNSREYQKNVNEDFYTKNIKWKQNVEQFKQKQHLLNERKSYQECYFRPVTNKSLHDATLPKRKEKRSDDIYVKNIEWLKKVNESRKQMDLEHMEEIRKDPEMEKIRDILAKSRSMKNLIGKKSEVQNFSSERGMSPEDQLKINLVNSTASPYNLSSIGSGISIRNDGMPSTCRDVEQFVVEKEISEIKNLITSLKKTLEENQNISNIDRTLNVQVEDHAHTKNDFIIIDQSCNVNLMSPSKSLVKKNGTLDNSTSKKKRKEKDDVSIQKEYLKKFQKLQEKYEKEKCEEMEAKLNASNRTL